MITVNGQNLDIEKINLCDYLKLNKYDLDRIAVELNGNIVKRNTYNRYLLSSGDKVEIVCFVGGG